MTDSELLKLDQMGFIPGPGETEEAFLSRVRSTQDRYENGKWIPEAHWDWVREYLYELFHVKPLYICAFYSNKGLAPWQGGASWIEGGKLNSIQLREAIKKGSFLGLYRREEILAHEAVHGMRCAFNENQSEEFFAYMTSEARWRRTLGPIFQKPWEVWPFLIFACAGIFSPFFILCNTVWTGIGFFRLILQHIRLKKVARKILEITGDSRRARAVLFRLTDEEIREFSKKNSIQSFSLEQNCLRWRVIRIYLEGTWQNKSL